MSSSSSVSVFDNHRFKTTFNEELYNTIVKNKKEQIALRGWRRLAAPKQEISIDLIHEFYANAVVTEEEMEEHGGYTFRSFVRGVPVDFSLENIRTVMRFRTQVGNMEAQHGLVKGTNPAKGQELNPIARGGMSFRYIHSYHPLTGPKFQ
ncbi:hypothetical protein PIB30_044925 [Stylosanthes scabra]|uniref:Uncharacterized protein n=1 Tax=Stylosanthes scabra TaxID=79078 RepID=A0ABU6YEX1_9FABA|nr:hypothetical protein [Stylosanthes scabra]